MQLKNIVFRGRPRHNKNCLQQEPHTKKMVACENFTPPPSPLPSKNDDPSLGDPLQLTISSCFNVRMSRY